MPSSQRAAESANAAPYLTHVVSHHGQTTLIPPDNAGRIRKVKGKRRPRTDGNVRREEEPRFNTGPPRFLKSHNARTTSRARLMSREARGQDEQDVRIPDDPPPSFQEAISAPGFGASNVSHPPGISIIIPATSQPAPQAPASASPPTDTLHSTRSSLAVNAPSPSSESSVEIVDVEPFQIEWEEDRRLGLPLEERVKRDWLRRQGANPAAVYAESHPAESKSLFEHREEDRKARRCIDLDEDASEVATIPSTLASDKKQGFVPFRALTRTPPAPVYTPAPAQIVPLSPTIPSAPYLFGRSPATSLRSTTSLGGPPLPSKSAPLKKLEGRIPRRLFKGKGKEKASLSEGCRESLDTWVVVDSDDESPPPGSPLATQGGTFNFPKRSSPSGFRKFLKPPADTRVTPFPPPSESAACPELNHIQKAPPVAFLDRPLRTPISPSPPSKLSISTVTTGASGSSEASPSPIKRRPAPPVPTKRGFLSTAAILPSIDSAYEQALSVPLPTSPIEPVAQSFNFGPLRLPDPILPERRPQGSTTPSHQSASSEPQYGSNITQPQPFFNVAMSSQQHSQDDIPFPSSPTGSISSVVSAPPQIPSMSYGVPPPRSRHYAGRPLPRTPLTLPSREPAAANPAPSEELLIDFDTECPNPPAIASPQNDSQDPDLNVFERRGSPPPLSSVDAERPSAFSQLTDLDVLLSRLEDDDRSGANYDALLLVSEIVGPASSQTTRSDSQPSPSHPLRGQIVVDRRRVTKDGRVKLKLSLLSAVVDRCGICFSQFKEGEWAVSGQCRHAFHEKCIKLWLSQKQTCPMCRMPLEGVQTP